MSATPHVPALGAMLCGIAAMAGIAGTLVEGLFDTLSPTGHMSPEH